MGRGGSHRRRVVHACAWLGRITRFPVDHLRTTIAGSVDLPEDAEGEPVPAYARVERFAAIAAEEALAALDGWGYVARGTDALSPEEDPSTSWAKEERPPEDDRDPLVQTRPARP